MGGGCPTVPLSCPLLLFLPVRLDSSNDPSRVQLWAPDVLSHLVSSLRLWGTQKMPWSRVEDVTYCTFGPTYRTPPFRAATRGPHASALTLPARLPQRVPARPRLPARGPATASRGDAAVESSQTPHNPPDTRKRASLSPPGGAAQKCCARRPMRTLPPWPALVLPARHRLPKADICIASRGGAAVEPPHAPQPAPSSSKATSKNAAQKVL